MVEKEGKRREKGWQTVLGGQFSGVRCGMYGRQILHLRNSHIIISTTAFSPNNCEGKRQLLFFYLSMLFQMPTFLEIASELSKTSLRLMKEDTAQRNGDSEGSLGGVCHLGWPTGILTFGRDQLSREIGKSSPI